MDLSAPPIVVKNLAMAYGERIIQQDLGFTVQRADIFVIMGGSGCGKSTLLRHLIGLKAPAAGDVWFEGDNLWQLSPAERTRILRRAGVLYQSGALWSSMTLGENLALPLEQYTDLSRAEITDMVALKLALVGLAGYEEYYPSEISGGMRKRAGLARAMALDPDILFFDEPSAGLDPVSAKRLDDLILELRDSLGATVVMVTHELASIFYIGNNSVFLDSESRTMIAQGDPKTLLKESTDPRVRRFLTPGRGEVKQHASPALIGSFVIGAIALTILGVLFFGAGNYFIEPTRYVMYFTGSVNGLDIGAPVKFRGVKVGSVSAIELQIDSQGREVHIPVLADMSAKLVKIFQEREDLDGKLFLDEMIRRGLRAQLKEQSLVTGKLMIELEYHPESPLVLTGNYDDLREIPGIPSDFEQIAREVRKGLVLVKQLPVEEIFARLLSTLEGIDQLVRSQELARGIRAARGAADELRQLAAATRSQVEPLSRSLDTTLAELRVTLTQVRTLSGNLDQELPSVSADLQAALKRAYSAAEQAEGAFAGMNKTLLPDSPLRYKLDRALDELTAAVRSLRVTADYLQQNPNSVIFGKGGFGQR